MWFDEFLKTVQEFDKQLDTLKSVCEQYDADYEQMKKDAEYLAKTTTMSNLEALNYIITQTREDEWRKQCVKSYARIKEENKMTDYKFNVGDYVETVDGRVGYITDVVTNNFAIGFYWTQGCAYHNRTLAEQGFKRIGCYTFQSEHSISNTSKISKVEINGHSFEMAVCLLSNKINEIIDKLNAMS